MTYDEINTKGVSVISDEINTNGSEGREYVQKQCRLNEKKINLINIFLSWTNRFVENEDQIYTRLHRLNNVESYIVLREETYQIQRIRYQKLDFHSNKSVMLMNNPTM